MMVLSTSYITPIPGKARFARIQIGGQGSGSEGTQSCPARFADESGEFACDCHPASADKRGARNGVHAKKNGNAHFDICQIIVARHFLQDSLPEWSKGVDSSSTSESCVGSNPTAVMRCPGAKTWPSDSTHLRNQTNTFLITI